MEEIKKALENIQRQNDFQNQVLAENRQGIREMLGLMQQVSLIDLENNRNSHAIY